MVRFMAARESSGTIRLSARLTLQACRLGFLLRKIVVNSSLVELGLRKRPAATTAECDREPHSCCEFCCEFLAKSEAKSLLNRNADAQDSA